MSSTRTFDWHGVGGPESAPRRQGMARQCRASRHSGSSSSRTTRTRPRLSPMLASEGDETVRACGYVTGVRIDHTRKQLFRSELLFGISSFADRQSISSLILSANDLAAQAGFEARLTGFRAQSPLSPGNGRPINQW